MIGRNEGQRLERCLQSTAAASPVVYVDSGSKDGSREWARDFGAKVINLDLTRPFTAARARNAGFDSLEKLAPDCRYVQFIDGDCEMVGGWPADAISFLEAHPDVAAVAGRRRERFPDRSIYNWLCDCEWAGPAGETTAFGGDVMMRRAALEAVSGYRDDMIAGEEPELGVRLRAVGWKIWRLEREMTLHDAGMTRFAQWWRRS
ncbi:MAG: glycosyltransferase family 2 protein, partial [Xanthobacteraceae bacterium]